MKIVCETNVVRRSSSDLKGRFVKSSLAIGKKDDKSKLCLILITANNKSGTKYDLTNNISNIFRKFVDQGKCTISLKLPDVDLQIKSDPIQMKAFLNVLKSELCPQPSGTKDVLKPDNKLIKAFGSSSKAIENTTRLTIKERSALPSKGFPRTLIDLAVTDIGCAQMPIGILNLSNLLTLDLSNNQIELLPKAFGNLKITKLNLSKNQFGNSALLKDWSWLNGANIQRSLNTLNVSGNKLKFIPSTLCSCVNLGSLDASFNQITNIPTAIHQLTQLKTLNLSSNNIKALPYTITKRRFDVVDISSNSFPSDDTVRSIVLAVHIRQCNCDYRAPSLLEISARAVIKHRVPYLNEATPAILKDILFFSPLCANPKCEALCFDMKTFNNCNLIQLNSKQRITSYNQSYFPAEGPFCSRSCSKAVYNKLFKHLRNQ